MEFSTAIAHKGMRLDAFLAEHLNGQSRAKIQREIREGACAVDGKTATSPSFRLNAGQKVSFNPAPTHAAISPTDGPLEVIFADSHIAIVNKPAGLTVHPCPSCKEETLAHRLLRRFPTLEQIGGERPGIAHRLDKNTSGLMVIGLTEDDRLALSEAFEERKIHKKYLAIVAGVPPQDGECNKSIGRHPVIKTRMAILDEKKGGRCAYTSWRRLWTSQNEAISLLEVSIKTGRTHQIRVHLASMGWPVIGDEVYGTKATAALAPRQMLHSWRLGLAHPKSGAQLDFSVSPPEDFYHCMLNNSGNSQKIVVTGNQGCGKSSFCHNLERLGLPVISADAIVSSLYGSNGEAAQWIGEHFGFSLLHPDKSVNKKALFHFMDLNPHLRRELEQVVHSLVRDRIEKFWAKQINTKNFASVAEIPLYFESGFQHVMRDVQVIGISCPQEKRWDRIKGNRGWDLKKIEAIEHWQWPENEKMEACDIVVSNAGSENVLAAEAQKIYQMIMAKHQDIVTDLETRLRRLCTA